MMAAAEEPRRHNGRQYMKNGLALSLVLVHFAVLVIHGASHAHLSLGASAWQKAFIGGIIFAAPLIATVLLWTRMRELGVLLLGLSLTGSLVFGVSYHFLIAGQDNVRGQCHSPWGLAFQATAILLAMIEVAGLSWCMRSWRGSHRAVREQVCSQK